MGEGHKRDPRQGRLGILGPLWRRQDNGLILDKSITVTVTHRKFGKEPEWSEWCRTQIPEAVCFCSDFKPRLFYERWLAILSIPSCRVGSSRRNSGRAFKSRRQPSFYWHANWGFFCDFPVGRWPLGIHFWSPYSRGFCVSVSTFLVQWAPFSPAFIQLLNQSNELIRVIFKLR